MVCTETRGHSLSRDRSIWWALFALAALLFVPACSQPAPSPGSERPVTVDLPTEPLTLDLAKWRDSHARKICMLIGDTLVAYDATLQIVPRIAERWESFDDGRRLVFHLRRDVRWHDGVAVTARDAVHTWELLRDPIQGSPAKSVKFAAMQSVRAIDDWTVETVLSQRYAGALEAWATNPLLPAHRKLEAENPIGCGAWRFVSWERGRRIVLRANPEHFEPPVISELRFEIIPDYTTRYNGLRAGQIDLTSLHPEIATKAEHDVEFTKKFEMIEQRFPFLFYVAWLGDGRNPYFVDPRVRRALTLAIDRESYIQHVTGGLGIVGITVHHPDLPGFDPSVKAWPYDPAAAAALLREAGWIDSDHDGTLDKDGKPFRFALTYGRNTESERIGVYIQGALGKLGLQCHPEGVENAVLFERLSSRQFDAIMLGTWLDPDPDFFDMLHSSQHPTGQNYAGLNDPQIDQWLEQARSSIDFNARRRPLELLQARLHELEPMTVLFYPISRIAVRRDLLGVRGCPLFWESRPGVAAWHWARSP